MPRDNHHHDESDGEEGRHPVPAHDERNGSQDDRRRTARGGAQTLERTGWVENEDDGSVTLEVQGDPEKFLRLFAMIQKSDYIQITGIRQKDLPPDPWERGFSVKGY